MKKIFIPVLILTLILTISAVSMASSTARQNVGLYVHEMCLLKATPSAGALHVGSSSTTVEAGSRPYEGSTSGRAQYTSIVAERNKRNLTAELDSFTIPAGLELFIAPGGSRYPITGVGDLGDKTSGGSWTKGTSNKTIVLVKGIRSCYTGTGADDGLRIDYAIRIIDSKMGDLVAGNYTVPVLLTLTD